MFSLWSPGARCTSPDNTLDSRFPFCPRHDPFLRGLDLLFRSFGSLRARIREPRSSSCKGSRPARTAFSTQPLAAQTSAGAQVVSAPPTSTSLQPLVWRRASLKNSFGQAAVFPSAVTAVGQHLLLNSMLDKRYWPSKQDFPQTHKGKMGEGPYFGGVRSLLPFNNDLLLMDKILHHGMVVPTSRLFPPFRSCACKALSEGITCMAESHGASVNASSLRIKMNQWKKYKLGVPIFDVHFCPKVMLRKSPAVCQRGGTDCFLSPEIVSRDQC